MVLDLYVPRVPDAARPPVVVWVHGGGGMNGDRRYLPAQWTQLELFERVLAAGFALATVDYRHLREAGPLAGVHDVKAAVRYLRTFADGLGIDGDRIALWGESWGGFIASLAGLGRVPELEGDVGVPGVSSEVRAVVDWYAGEPTREGVAVAAPGAVDMLGADGADELWRLLLPSTHITPEAPPFLLVHGTEDQGVPVEWSVRLHELLESHGVDSTLVLVPGADHVFVGVDERPLIDEAIAFLAGHLRG